MLFKFTRLALVAVVIGCVLAGCGGGGGATGAAAGAGAAGSPAAGAAGSLSGTVAGGAAVIGTVVVTDSKGVTRSAAIDASTGHYAVDVSGMTGPFLLKATGTVGKLSVVYYSAATGADVGGTINITPFTSLMVSNLAGQMAETHFDDPAHVAGIGTLFTSDKLAAAEKAMRDELQPILASLGLGSGVDLLRTSFAADHSGMDAVLDLVTVEVDAATNVAILRNAITRNEMGRDNVGDRKAKVPVVDHDDITASAAADLRAIITSLKEFAAQFAKALPSAAELQNSGVFDTSSAFLMGGQTFAQFAISASSQTSALGLAFDNVSIRLLASGLSGTLSASVTSNSATFADQVPLKLVKLNGKWLVQGDGMIASLALTAQAQRDNWTLLNSAPANGSSGTLASNGIWIHIDPSAHNANHPSSTVASASITGPGLGANGVTFVKEAAYAWLSLQGSVNGAKVIPECASQVTQQCVNVAQALDNSAYTLVLRDGSGNSLNGAGYTLVLTKQPFSGSAVLPAFGAVTVDGAALTPAAVQANKTVVVTWTLPDGFSARNLNVWATTSSGASFVDVERSLAHGDLGASVALGTPKLPGAAAANAGVWFSAVDSYGRRVVLSQSVSNQ